MTNDRVADLVDDAVDVEGIRRYLRNSDVLFAVLFGSLVSDTAHESSDVDVALQFPDEMTSKERFRHRNRLDAELQTYAERFVDVSDIEALPVPVARAALRDGIRLVGDEQEINAYRKRVESEYETSAERREQERREFIDRLAKGEL
ncbi:nucleotidyltransferase domain-containing protein [Halorhabdus sp. CBA1104]|uniref:type VII toxin-antitoxin system MntA family adenylyltransferase antitoxin n=1 Tax=Halorhabdus sp. CBA1104 TaxID=1380432 RepID=UPI0012B32A2A|nr:nucleotidyltransferase domain-containing protein [Halorhabdus sp. CBA1104]QGN07406.1 nucleotidyltransferase domain-containing protein [Halorhabdus sp. CBA1104]